MVLIELTDFHAENLYEYSFDQMVDTFKPLRSEEEKKYITVRRYPTAFKILPLALRVEYPSLSRSSIEIYATRLGLSKFSHDPRVSEIVDICSQALSEATSENLGLCDVAIHRIGYNYVTQVSNNSRTNLSTTEEVKSFLTDKGDYIGIPEGQIAILLFYIGIESASMNKTYKELIQKEIAQFWSQIDRRLFILRNYGFK